MATPQGQQQPWWMTQPWWNKEPELANPTTWPVLSPLVATLNGVNGGANWVPGLSPVLRGPVNAIQAGGQGAVSGLSNTVTGFFKNPNPQTLPNGKGAPAAPPPAWDFATLPNGQGGSGTSPTMSPGDIGAYVQQRIPGTVISGGVRTPERNAEVNGVPNSQHLAANGGMARDLQPPPGSKMSIDQFAREVRAIMPAGWEVISEPKRNHVHVELRTPGVPFSMPNLPMMDPRMANALPMPGPARTIDLPDPVAMPDMPARPVQADVPVAEWMALLQQGAPKPFDEADAKKQRLGQVISGIAQGAAAADPMEGIGPLLAQMGAGGSKAQALWEARTREERKEADEATRLFQLGLARDNINLQGQQRGVRQANAESAWQDQRDSLMTKYRNEDAKVQNETKEMLTNNGILSDHDSLLFQATTNRARAALSIIESNTQTARMQATGRAELDLKRFLYEDEKATRGIGDDVAKSVRTMAGSIGLVPEMAAKDPVGLNALQAAGYMRMKNKPAAVNALAREAVLSGQYGQLIRDENVKKQISTLAAKDPELAAAALGQMLNAWEIKEPGTVPGLAAAMAQSGLPTATLFSKYAQPVAGAK